jgi:hypothetical protein
MRLTNWRGPRAVDPDQRRHLRGLAGLSTAAGETHTDDALPRLQRLVNAAAPNIASVYDMHFDYVVWNEPYRRLRNDPAQLPAERRNLLWMMFSDAKNRARMVRWEPAARAVLSQFRAAAGQRPDDPRFAALVAELTEASAEFRAGSSTDAREPQSGAHRPVVLQSGDRRRPSRNARANRSILMG